MGPPEQLERIIFEPLLAKHLPFTMKNAPLKLICCSAEPLHVTEVSAVLVAEELPGSSMHLPLEGFLY